MLDLKKCFVLSEDIVIRGVGEKYWALNVKNGKQFRLNSTSYSIMNAFRKETSLYEVIDLIEKEYNVDRQRIIDDCNVVIPYAIEKQLIKEVIA